MQQPRGGEIQKVPVVAAIPNYNMADNLAELLPQVLAQHYDSVFVLDDSSTDHSIDVVGAFAGEVTLVRSRHNRGAGANRNQILDYVPDEAIVHFIDADVDLDTGEIPELAREIIARYADQGIGLVGGLVRQCDGGQYPYNYGAVFSLWGNFTSNLPRVVDQLRTKPRLARVLQWAAGPAVRGWPNVLAHPLPTAAYWVSEANMLIRSSVFRSVGGYDPRLRSHEIQDLAIRLNAIGIRRQFDPRIAVVHNHVDVRGEDRNRWANEATAYLIRKHGLYRFLTAH